MASEFALVKKQYIHIEEGTDNFTVFPVLLLPLQQKKKCQLNAGIQICQHITPLQSLISVSSHFKHWFLNWILLKILQT